MMNAIAMDGPAASGKSTIAKMLADYFGLIFFDTGVMYRAVTLAALQQGIDVQNELDCSQLAENTLIEVETASKEDGRANDILINGKDQTWEIRQPLVDQNVSFVSRYAGVRTALTRQQRRIAEKGKIIMVGRDIGTVVIPEAKIKLFLDASAEERARRRYQEQLNRGDKVQYEDILKVVRERDEIDSTRAVAPLVAAVDAIVLDTDGKEINEVFEEAKKIIEKRL